MIRSPSHWLYTAPSFLGAGRVVVLLAAMIGIAAPAQLATAAPPHQRDPHELEPGLLGPDDERTHTDADTLEPGVLGPRDERARLPGPDDELEPGLLGPDDELEPGLLGPDDELEPGVIRPQKPIRPAPPHAGGPPGTVPPRRRSR